MRVRTGAINELKAMIVTADETLRAELRGLRTPARSRRVPSSVTVRAAPSTSAAPAPRCAPWRAGSSTSTPRVDDHDRPARAPRQAAPQLDRRTRHRLHHRRRVLRRLVTSRPLPQRGRFRPPRRHRTGPRHLRTEPDPPSPQPRRRPPTQPGALPRRHHQATLRPRHPRLHRPTRRRRQDRTRSHPLHQALPRPPHLAAARVLERHGLLRVPRSRTHPGEGWAGVKGGPRPAKRTLDAGPCRWRRQHHQLSPRPPGQGLLALVRRSESTRPPTSRGAPKSTLDRHGSITCAVVLSDLDVEPAPVAVTLLPLSASAIGAPSRSGRRGVAMALCSTNPRRVRNSCSEGVSRCSRNASDARPPKSAPVPNTLGYPRTTRDAAAAPCPRPRAEQHFPTDGPTRPERSTASAARGQILLAEQAP